MKRYTLFLWIGSLMFLSCEVSDPQGSNTGEISADFIFTPETCVAPCNVIFTSLVDNADQQDWRFVAESGAAVGFDYTEQNRDELQFAFDIAGEYSVTLSAFNSESSDQITKQIMISEEANEVESIGILNFDFGFEVIPIKAVEKDGFLYVLGSVRPDTHIFPYGGTGFMAKFDLNGELVETKLYEEYKFVEMYVTNDNRILATGQRNARGIVVEMDRDLDVVDRFEDFSESLFTCITSDSSGDLYVAGTSMSSDRSGAIILKLNSNLNYEAERSIREPELDLEFDHIFYNEDRIYVAIQVEGVGGFESTRIGWLQSDFNGGLVSSSISEFDDVSPTSFNKIDNQIVLITSKGINNIDKVFTFNMQLQEIDKQDFSILGGFDVQVPDMIEGRRGFILSAYDGDYRNRECQAVSIIGEYDMADKSLLQSNQFSCEDTEDVITATQGVTKLSNGDYVVCMASRKGDSTPWKYSLVFLDNDLKVK